MRGLVIETDGTISTRAFSEPLYKTVGEVVGGTIEIVHPRHLPVPYVMIVNDEGLLEKLTLNTCGSLLYGTPEHGHPIVGNIVIMREGFNADGEPDIIGLTPGDDPRIFNAGAKAINNWGGGTK